MHKLWSSGWSTEKLRHFVGPLAFTALFVCAVAVLAGPADGGGTPDVPVQDRCVILISLDGFANFYLADAQVHAPTLRRLAREGAVAEQGLACSFPTVTWPNHTTLVTGVPPAEHGVLANSVFDRVTGEPVQLLVDPVFDKDQIVRAPTVYDVAHQAGLKTAAVVWPATRNAKTLNWTVPDMKSPLFEKYATPGWLDELKAEGIPVDRYGPWVDAPEGGPRRDWIAMREVVSLLRHQRPQLILLHLIELDHAQHASGPRSGDSIWAVSTMDDRIRDLCDAIDELGLRDKVTLIVASDHGFFAVDKSVFVNVRLRELGLITVENKKVVSKQAWSVSQGGAAAVYVIPTERRAEMVSQIKQAMRGMEGVEAVYEPEDFAQIGQATADSDKFAPDLWLAAKEGYVFSNDAAADVRVRTNPKRDGSHGYAPQHPDMRGILIAWGRAVPPGTKLGLSHNTQVAPTIARLLDLKMPSAKAPPLQGIATAPTK